MAVALCLFLIALSPIVSANINCASPQSLTYQMSDNMTFSWGDDGTIPSIVNLKNIGATLWCSADSKKIADIVLPNIPPLVWPVPFIGNATTAGGNQGPCANNAFHVEYRGEFWDIFLTHPSPFGPVRCAPITIMPAPNTSFPFTTSFERSSSTTTTKSSSSTPSPTVVTTPIVGQAVSTTVIIIIAVKRMERMETIKMPLQRQREQEFDKASTTDVSRGNVSDAGVHGAAAGAAILARKAPQTISSNDEDDDDRGSGGGDGRYKAYERQATNESEGVYRRQQRAYEDLDDEDNYYNPYYAQSAATAAVAAALPRGRPSYYSGFSTSDYSVGSPFSDPYSHQQDSKTGYPPPPSSNIYARSSTTSLPVSSVIVGPHASVAYASSALNIVSTPSDNSSPRRAPQAMPEKGEKGSLPMQDRHKVEVRR
ncbi:hypothetical protein DFQ26_008547 [Actinomortierella ambigua]|nr:hypothetical protein DFQ26_008547 [Actinomortierella ambigua]